MYEKIRCIDSNRNNPLFSLFLIFFLNSCSLRKRFLYVLRFRLSQIIRKLRMWHCNYFELSDGKSKRICSRFLFHQYISDLINISFYCQKRNIISYFYWFSCNSKSFKENNFFKKFMSSFLLRWINWCFWSNILFRS